jgi:hypothetical protein
MKVLTSSTYLRLRSISLCSFLTFFAMMSVTGVDVSSFWIGILFQYIVLEYEMNGL